MVATHPRITPHMGCVPEDFLNPAACLSRPSPTEWAQAHGRAAAGLPLSMAGKTRLGEALKTPPCAAKRTRTTCPSS